MSKYINLILGIGMMLVALNTMFQSTYTPPNRLASSIMQLALCTVSLTRYFDERRS